MDKRLENFKRLADSIGPGKVIWRYDPIFTNEKYSVRFHQEKFAKMAGSLNGYTEKCMLGFIDPYRHIRTAIGKYHIRPLQQTEVEEVALAFRRTMDSYPSMRLETCTVKVDLRHLGIPAGLCIDNQLIEKIAGYPIKACKDQNQRNICNCVESIDIGTYETCLNGCIYCYAIRGNYTTARRNAAQHEITSPLLNGGINEGDIVKERPVKSLRTDQLSLF